MTERADTSFENRGQSIGMARHEKAIAASQERIRERYSRACWLRVFGGSPQIRADALAEAQRLRPGLEPRD